MPSQDPKNEYNAGEESKGAAADSASDSSTPDLEALCEEERRIIQAIKKLAQTKGITSFSDPKKPFSHTKTYYQQEKDKLAAFINVKLFERIARHLCNLKRFQYIEPAYVTKIDYAIFLEQAMTMAIKTHGEYRITVDCGTPDHIKRQIEALEKQIFQRVNELAEQHPFSKNLVLQRIKNELSETITEFVRVTDEFKYILFDPEATRKRRQAGFESFLLQLTAKLSQSKPSEFMTKINSIAALKTKKDQLSATQQRITSSIRALQRQAELDPTQKSTLKTRIVAQHGKELLDLRQAFHQLINEANEVEDHGGATPASEHEIEQETHDFIQWHLDNSEKKLTPEYQKQLDIIAGLAGLRKARLTEQSALALKSEIQRRVNRLITGSREQYSLIVNTLDNSELDIAKTFILTCFPIFIGNHRAIMHNGFTNQNNFPRQEICATNQRLISKLKSATDTEQVRNIFHSALDKIGIPRKICNGKSILYPATPTQNINDAEPEEPKKKRKPRKKKPGSRGTDVLEQVTKQVGGYLQQTVTCSRDEDELIISLQPGEVKLKKEGEQYALTDSDTQLSLLYDSTKISKLNFIELLLNRINLMQTQPAVAAYIEALKASLRSDDCVATVRETAINSNTNCHLSFHTDDKCEFAIQITSNINVLEQVLMQKGKNPCQLLFRRNITSSTSQLSDTLTQPTLLLITSPLFPIAAATSHLLISQGYGCQPFLLENQINFEDQISLAIVTPDKSCQTISIIQQEDDLYLYFMPGAAVNLNPDLPRFKLDANRAQPLERQILDILQTKSEPITKLLTAQQCVSEILNPAERAYQNISELVCQYLEAYDQIDAYAKLFNACRTLETQKSNWAREFLPALDDSFLQHLDQFIRQSLGKARIDSSTYPRALISLTNSIAREINKHKIRFASLYPRVAKKLCSLHELQYKTLAALLPLHLLDKAELLTHSEMKLIDEKIRVLSCITESASKGLANKLTLLSKQLQDKVAFQLLILKNPYRELPPTHYPIHQELTADNLSHIKHASPETLTELLQLVEFIDRKEARIYLSGSAGLELAGKLPKPKQPHSDIDLIICASESDIVEIRKHVNKLFAIALRPFGPSQQFIGDTPGQTKFEVITTTESIEAVLEAGSCSTHNAYVELTANDSKLYLTSMHGYVPDETCCPSYHIDEKSFRATQYNLRERVKCFLFSCKLACKYEQDFLSQALLQNLAERIAKEPAHNRRYMASNTQFIHPYVREYIREHFPAIATWFLLETPPQGSLPALSTVANSVCGSKMTKTATPPTSPQGR